MTAAARPVTPSAILASELDDLLRDIDSLPDVDPRIAARLRRARDLAVGLDPYLALCTTPESAALAEISRRTRETDWARAEAGGLGLEQEMLSGHLEGQALKFLVHLAGATRVLDIGMFTGYSALAMAEALPDEGTVTACEIDPAVADFAMDCFQHSPAGAKITVKVGQAIDTLAHLAAAGSEFDFVFLDADKPGYLDYLDFLLRNALLAPRGVIVVDNTLLQGEPYADGEISINGAAIAAFNAAVMRDNRVEQVLIPLRDGLTLIRRAQR